MKNVFLAFLATMMISVSSFSQSTNGTVTFTVTTLPSGGEYSPKNVFAVWIKNSSGTFIRSMKVMAANRIQYLYQWKQSSQLNNVDAVTGATLNSHQTHSITWDCKDLDGNVVSDGDYEFWVEFTEKDGQGPYTHYTFTKSTSAVSHNYTDQTGFKNVSLTYTPSTTDVGVVANDEVVIVKEEGSNQFSFSIPLSGAENVTFKVFNISGQQVYQTNNYFDNGSSMIFRWSKPNSYVDVFIFQVESSKGTYSGKFQ